MGGENTLIKSKVLPPAFAAAFVLPFFVVSPAAGVSAKPAVPHVSVLHPLQWGRNGPFRGHTTL